MPKAYKRKTDRPYRQRKTSAVPMQYKEGFLSSLRSNSELAKALREDYDEIVNDLGGPDELSCLKRKLIEKAVWLDAILQTIQNDLASGEISKTEAIGRWIQAINALQGLAKTLGIDRQAKVLPWLAPAAKSVDEEPAEVSA